jgi:hypothetical protein
MTRHRKSHKNSYRKQNKRKTAKKLRGGAAPDFISMMKSLIPPTHTVSPATGSGMPTPASEKNPYTKGGTKKYRQRGGLARYASRKTWVCRGNIGCANNINIY